MLHQAWQVLEAFETFKAIRAEQVSQPAVLDSWLLLFSWVTV